jgi:ATP-binding cassette subfamily B (MDR/TAP) protein 1
VGLVCTVVCFFAHFSIKLAAQSVGNNIRSAFFRSILAQEIGFFDQISTEALVHSLDRDVEKITSAIANWYGYIFVYGVQLLLGVFMALVASWQIALRTSSSVPLILVIIVIDFLAISYISNQIMLKSANASITARQFLNMIRTVRALNGEKKEEQRYAKDNAKVYEEGRIYALATGLTRSAMILLCFIAVPATLLYVKL